MIVDVAMIALRPKYKHDAKRIYAYETLSETGWDISNAVNAFIPTVHENIAKILNLKLEVISIYKSQLDFFPEARSIVALESLAKFRGATVNCCGFAVCNLVHEIN